MASFIISFAVGILVGILYGLLGVRSPAPPYVALIGLLGMLIGESVVPIAKDKLSQLRHPTNLEAKASPSMEH